MLAAMMSRVSSLFKSSRRSQGNIPPIQQQQQPSPFTLNARSESLSPLQTSRFDDDDTLPDAELLTSDAVEPEPDIQEDTLLSLTARVEYSALAVGRTRSVFGLVTVKAAKEVALSSSDTATERQAMDLICVLDVSGSMGSDNKLEELRNAVRFIIGEARDSDRISIVTFNSSARRQTALKRMDAGGKDESIQAILRLNASGGTTIAAGLGTALQIVEQRRQRNKVTAILLLTDGQDGSFKHSLPQQVRQAANLGCSLYAFGFGNDHDAAMLRDISEQARTPYTFVESEDTIREAFAGVVGGLSSMVAQSLRLRLLCRVPLSQVHTPFAVQRSGTENLEGNGLVEVATVSVPDFFAGERRDVLLELSVPSDLQNLPSVDGQTILLEADLQYRDLCQNVMVRTPAVALKIQCVDEEQPEMEPDAEVADQRDRVEVARVLEQAAASSDAGNFEEAQRLLQEQQRKVVSRQTPVAVALGTELEDARQRMQDHSQWQQAGRAEVYDAMQMHKMQRCTNNIASRSAGNAKCAKAMYLSPVQAEWISKSKA